jgi:hypothetical protein
MDDTTSQGKSLDERLAEAISPEPVGEVKQENQPEPVPSSEQKQTEEVSPTDEASTDEEQIALENAKNPERTKEYIEKLKAQLAQAQAKELNYGDSVFDTFRPQQKATQPEQVDTSAYGNLNPQQVDSITSRFVDDEGNVDINGLNQALTQADQRAAQAEQRAKSVEDRLERYEESQQVREAHAVHPWLDPKNPDFDPVRFEMVRDRILRVKYYEGQPISLLDAADYVAQASGSKATPVNLDKVQEEAVNKYKESQTKRQQGPIETGKGEPRDTQDYSELRVQTRNENPSDNAPALEERLARLGILSKKDS